MQTTETAALPTLEITPSRQALFYKSGRGQLRFLSFIRQC